MKKFWVLFPLIFCLSCATYYQRHLKFNSYFEQGKLKEADDILASDKKAEKRKDKLLYYLNRGTVHSMLGNYDQSNAFFESAHRMAETHRKNVLNEGVSFLTNSNFSEYEAEDFEHFLINYYKALNYLKQGNTEAALVEAKRMNIVLSEVETKYSNPDKFQKDAFVHLLMGLIYDANKDYNNAFIAYRNSLEIYQKEYKTMFGLEAPEQLKKDILRTAALSGFMEDVSFFERTFNMKYTAEKAGSPELVFFWHSGLGPVKSEWSINFNIIRGQGGNVMFVNEQMGLSFPFPITDDNYNSSGLSKVEFVRVAFPKYIERTPLYTNAEITVGGKSFSLEKTEDINAIAFKSLKDRMLLELGKSLLRVGLKKAAEYNLRSQNDGAGAALGLLNAITEKADTRNWQSVPHGIYYTRMPLAVGKQEVVFKANGNNVSPNTQTFTFDVKPGEKIFQTISTLDMQQGLVPNQY
ncbi:MAG TPA: hypothetical protein VF691_11930 [Cytophagaceae bacterium]|jgi:hypothetical protein